jgi:hypothetical protein
VLGGVPKTYRCGIQSGQRRHGGRVAQRITPGKRGVIAEGWQSPANLASGEFNNVLLTG